MQRVRQNRGTQPRFRGGGCGRPLGLAVILLLVLAGGGLLAAQEGQVPAAEVPEGDEILRAMEETLFPDSYSMTMEMTTEEPGKKLREMTLESLYRRGTGTFMEIQSPRRSKGTRFLEKEDTLWMYIPRSNSRSAIRLSPRDSFQGSTFANDDIGDSSYTDDYEASLEGGEVMDHPDLGKADCWVISITPKRKEAAYGRIRAWVTKERMIPLRMEYHVRSGLKTKVMDLFDIEQAAGRLRPLRMEMRSLDQEGKVSVVRISEMEKRENLPDRIFTRRYLTR